ncbi:MAG: hypothetical protein AB7N76_31060 [Planctomycetota bacterium]
METSDEDPAHEAAPEVPPEDLAPEDGTAEDEDLADEAEEEDLADEAEDEDPDADGVVMRPFPGMEHSSLFGMAGVGALRGGEGPQVLAGELPGEVLLELRGARPGSGRVSLVLLVSLALLASPLVIFWDFRATRDASRLLGGLAPESFVPTSLLLVGVGLALALWVILRGVLSRTTLTLTSEGVALDAPSGAEWLEWSELRRYSLDAGVLRLRGDERELSFLVAPEQQAALCELLDRRGLDRVG